MLWTAAASLQEKSRHRVRGERLEITLRSSYRIACDDAAAAAGVAGIPQSYANPRSSGDADQGLRPMTATADAADVAAETGGQSAVGFGSSAGTVGFAANAAAGAVAAAVVVGTAQSGAAAAVPGGGCGCAAGGDREWATPRPPGQSFAGWTAADSTGGAASCERAAATKESPSELQLSKTLHHPGQCRKPDLAIGWFLLHWLWLGSEISNTFNERRAIASILQKWTWTSYKSGLLYFNETASLVTLWGPFFGGQSVKLKTVTNVNLFWEWLRQQKMFARYYLSMLISIDLKSA